MASKESDFGAARFRDEEEARQWADRQEDAFVQSIGVDELEALNIYSGAGYLRLNSALRGRWPLPEELFTVVLPLLDNVTQKAVLDRDTVLFRGAAMGSSGSSSPEALVGTIIRDRGFVSTSFDPRAAEDFVRDQPDPLIFEILAHTGQGVAFIGGFEREVLLPRNLRFFVVGFQPAREIGENSWPTMLMEIVP